MTRENSIKCKTYSMTQSSLWWLTSSYFIYFCSHTIKIKISEISIPTQICSAYIFWSQTTVPQFQQHFLDKNVSAKEISIKKINLNFATEKLLPNLQLELNNQQCNDSAKKANIKRRIYQNSSNTFQLINMLNQNYTLKVNINSPKWYISIYPWYDVMKMALYLCSLSLKNL